MSDSHQNITEGGREVPEALALLSSKRPRNLGWIPAAGLLYGDWGTSRLYVLGLAFVVAGRSSFFLVAAISLLILAVGWAYTQICRIYPHGGGVYSAARRASPVLGVIAALLLFADYTVTASLSSVEAFHYFGLGKHDHAEVVHADPGEDIRPLLDETKEGEVAPAKETIWQLNSPALWAMVAIVVIGGVNLLGPKHVAGPAMVVAGAMVVCTLVLVVCAMVQIEWGKLDLGSMWHQPLDLWRAFVAVVLALSGVEAISNLTGVMKQPVTKTAGRAIWVVAIEVAVLNILLGIAMVAAAPGRDEHTEDMLAFMAGLYVGPWFEVVVRIVAGVLLLSAANTAIGAIVGTLYVMSRDGELPAFFQKLNAFGTPWVGAVVGGVVPAVVLMFVSDLRTLAALYAIGIVGAVAINTGLCAYHPRLRRAWRKVLMGGISFLLAGVWITLAITKLPALLFVTLIMVVGLSARQFTRWKASRSRKPSLLRRAIMEQLTPEALGKRRLLLATAGGTQLAEPAMQMAAREDCSLVVCFVREVNLSFKVDERSLTLDTDPAADDLFTRFLELGHQYNVPVIPVYDTGPNSPEMIAEMAAIHGVEKVLIGSSRRGSLHQIIKGSFQRKIESLLPPETRVVVVTSATV